MGSTPRPNAVEERVLAVGGRGYIGSEDESRAFIFLPRRRATTVNRNQLQKVFFCNVYVCSTGIRSRACVSLTRPSQTRELSTCRCDKPMVRVTPNTRTTTTRREHLFGIPIRHIIQIYSRRDPGQLILPWLNWLVDHPVRAFNQTTRRCNNDEVLFFPH